MAKRLPKASELTYHGTEDKGPNKERTIVAAHEGRIVGHMSSAWSDPTRLGERSRGLSLAWVDPAYQRRGVASTMLGLERHRTGYTPVGDQVLSKKGQAFQRGAGVPTNPKGEAVALGAFGHDVSGPIQGLQGHVLQSPQFDQALVRRTAPPPKTRPKKDTSSQPEQGQLFDTSTMSNKGQARAYKNLEAMRRDEPPRSSPARTQRDARGRIQPRQR